MNQLYKCLNNIRNDALTVPKHGYNTRRYNLFVTGRPKTDIYGENSIPNRANQIWSLLPSEIKKIQQTWILLNQKLIDAVA